jgi:natural product biosynthesis luciferase-like monooxygenase protein
MDLGIMFFSTLSQQGNDNKYKLLMEAARFADEHDFCSIWTPERHFHEFGGLFPNPSVISAALAVVTKKLHIRAGSLISPLHDPIRIAEEWAVVDNLSEGRVGISFGSGWNADDFIFFPDRYNDRHKIMYQQILNIKKLWRGMPYVGENGSGKEIRVTIHPRPIQEELPVWITSSGNADTFVSAGAIGANLLTHLMSQDIDTLQEKIHMYRESRERNDYDPKEGKVSLMLHTFIGEDLGAVKDIVRGPFREYIRSAVNLEQKSANGGGVISGGHKIKPHDVSAGVMDELLDITFERYFKTAALMGTPSSCQQLVWDLKRIGVDEIACLIDFGIDNAAIIHGLRYLNTFKEMFSATALNDSVGKAVDTFMEDLEEV